MLLRRKRGNDFIVKGSRKLSLLGVALIFLVSCAGPSNSTPSQASPMLSITPPPSQSLATFQSPKDTPTLRPIASPTGTITPFPTPATTSNHIQTVFLIVMENHNWSDIYNNPSAPYINKTLLPQASYALQYFNPPGNHPSEPNYLWLEAGTNFGVKNDNPPDDNHQRSTEHLVTYLNRAGFTWKAYEEGISGKDCPLSDSILYASKHNPMVFFEDVTDGNNPNSAYCIAHERPFTELQSDLNNNTMAQYNFITPNLCNDMHDSFGCATLDEVKNGDKWLSEQIPVILASKTYQEGGVIFITWDESENGDHPIGMIILSPFAKGKGYTNSIHYTHSSTLRTIEEIFNLTTFLGDASKATDLSNLFSQFP
jgi:hypothetical protein